MKVKKHISLIQESGSIYMWYVVPNVGSAEGTDTATTQFLLLEEISQHHLMTICDGTNINTSK